MSQASALTLTAITCTSSIDEWHREFPFFEILCENDNFCFGFVLFGLNVLNMFVNRVSFADDGHAVEKIGCAYQISRLSWSHRDLCAVEMYLNKIRLKNIQRIEIAAYHPRIAAHIDMSAKCDSIAHVLIAFASSSPIIIIFIRVLYPCGNFAVWCCCCCRGFFLLAFEFIKFLNIFQ